MFLETVRDTEINQIMSLKTNTHVDWMMCKTMSKKSSYQVLKPLTSIVNTSLSTEMFPNSLKTAKVTPLIKKGETKNVNNHCPVSQLGVFSKIFECVFYNRLISGITKNSLVSANQHGFRNASLQKQQCMSI